MRPVVEIRVAFRRKRTIEFDNFFQFVSGSREFQRTVDMGFGIESCWNFQMDRHRHAGYVLGSDVLSRNEIDFGLHGKKLILRNLAYQLREERVEMQRVFLVFHRHVYVCGIFRIFRFDSVDGGALYEHRFHNELYLFLHEESAFVRSAVFEIADVFQDAVLVPDVQSVISIEIGTPFVERKRIDVVVRVNGERPDFQYFHGSYLLLNCFLKYSKVSLSSSFRNSFTIMNGLYQEWFRK